MTDVTSEYSRVNLSSDPVYRSLQITKGGPGGVPGDSSEQDVLDSPWLQRLRRIHQLQSAWWVFATAEHSRLQHSLGAMHLAGEWLRHLYPTLRLVHPDAPSLPLVEATLSRPRPPALPLARGTRRFGGRLPNLGHGPFGHFFDENYLDRWGIDHEVIGRRLISTELAPLIDGLGASPHGDFEPGEKVDPQWVAYLIAKDDLEGFVAPSWLAVLRP